MYMVTKRLEILLLFFFFFTRFSNTLRRLGGGNLKRKFWQLKQSFIPNLKHKVLAKPSRKTRGFLSCMGISSKKNLFYDGFIYLF